VQGHLGSVRQLVDAAGQVSLAQSYDPFGVLHSQHGTQNSQLPFGYTGEQADAGTGLLFLRARYYDPGVGRFLSKDRFSGDFNRPQTLSGWDYVENNPANLVDSTGFYSMKEIKGFFHNAPTYLDMLRYFEPGGHLEGRWGWLKVLRKAEDGDRIHVLHKYPYPGMDYYDPLIESWEWKADAIATQKYMGLRHDPALASFRGAMSSLDGIIAPDSVEEVLAIAAQVLDEAIRNGMVDAQGEFTQEVSMQLMKQLAKRSDPWVLAAMELLDLTLDINELKTDLGFIVAP
jgi:RHS repeat-associated protein